MKRNPLLKSALALALGLSALDASATVITFDLFSGSVVDHASPWAISSGGVTLTLSNPVGPTSGNGFTTDSDGLYLAPSGIWNGRITAFDLVFSSAVKVTGYEIGFVAGTPLASFALTGGIVGAASSLNNALTSVGTFNLSSDYILSANQTGNFAASGGGDGLTQLKRITVDTDFTPPGGGGTAVPEIDALAGTGALTLLGFGLALASERRRAA